MYCIYQVSAIENSHMPNDDATFLNDEDEGIENFPYTEPPLRPFTKGPPNVGFIIIDVQVS